MGTRTIYEHVLILRALDVIDVEGFLIWGQNSDVYDLNKIAPKLSPFCVKNINLRYLWCILQTCPYSFVRFLHDPRVPLYEVEAAEYSKILVDWNADQVVERYPKVEGVQHLQNPYVIAEGENLLPPFTDPAWTINSIAKIVGEYELETSPIAGYQYSYITIPIVPGQTYNPNFVNAANAFINLIWLDSNKSTITFKQGPPAEINIPLTSPNNSYWLVVQVGNSPGGVGTKIVHKNPVLTLGATAKPFVPRNQSYLLVA